MDLKPPLTVDQQIERLKSHNVVIEDEDEAKVFLSKNNYYRFTGYALSFRLSPNDSTLRDKVSFQHLVKLYRFDEELRSLLRVYIEKTEVYYRTLIAYRFSLERCSQAPHDQHYDPTSYGDSKKFSELKEKFARDRDFYKDSLAVKHHKKKYDGKMPLWVIVEILSYSALSKLYSCMTHDDQTRISNAVGASTGFLENHLHCLAVLRNKCAHAGRLYGERINPPAKQSSRFMQQNPEVVNNSLFSYVYMLKQRLPSNEDKKEFKESLVLLIKKFYEYIELKQIGFPENWESIL